MTFPRVLGIEASGEADLDTTETFEPGRKIMSMMGGMGRTAAVGQAAALAKQAGATVLSTTRSESKRPRLEQFGVDHVTIDDGNDAPSVRGLFRTASTVPSNRWAPRLSRTR